MEDWRVCSNQAKRVLYFRFLHRQLDFKVQSSNPQFSINWFHNYAEIRMYTQVASVQTFDVKTLADQSIAI